VTHDADELGIAGIEFRLLGDKSGVLMISSGETAMWVLSLATTSVVKARLMGGWPSHKDDFAFARTAFSPIIIISLRFHQYQHSIVPPRNGSSQQTHRPQARSFRTGSVAPHRQA
jgi:hypothetical protein